MFIKIQTLIEKYDLKINGIIHGGGHFAEEYDDYKACGIEDIIFIEPCQKASIIIYEKFAYNSRIITMQTALGDYNGTALMNTETANQGQSNSILKPKQHLVDFPSIKFEGTEQVYMSRLDDIEFDRSKYNFLNCDLQGFELLALKGAIKTLEHIDFCYLEINKAEMYFGNAMVDELDEFLDGFGFKRVETYWCNRNIEEKSSWGDGFWIKK